VTLTFSTRADEKPPALGDAGGCGETRDPNSRVSLTSPGGIGVDSSLFVACVGSGGTRQAVDGLSRRP